MGSRQSTNQRVTVRRQLSLQYAVAAGCTLAVVVGTGIFAYLNLSNSSDSLAANTHFYAVKPGQWTDPSAWEGGVVPPATDIKHNVEILGRTVRQGSLNYKKGSGKTLTVKDTLVIEGDLTLGNKSNLTVNEGGVLMVAGNFTVAKKSEIINYGTIAIGGNWDLRAIDKVDYRGDSSRLFHFGEAIADGKVIEFGQTEEDLQKQHASVYAWVKTKSDALKPIFFSAILQQGKVLTQWQSGNKTAYTNFTVEKSADGIVFDELVVVPGGTNSMIPTQDSYIDAHPATGMSYYRLKRVGLENDIAYSKLVMVANWGDTFSGNNQVGR